MQRSLSHCKNTFSLLHSSSMKDTTEPGCLKSHWEPSLGVCNNSWCLTLALRKCQTPVWTFGNLTINTTGSGLYTAAQDAGTGVLTSQGKQCPSLLGIWPLPCAWPHSVTAAGSVLTLKVLKTTGFKKILYPLIIWMNSNPNNTATREAPKVRILELRKRQKSI